MPKPERRTGREPQPSGRTALLVGLISRIACNPCRTRRGENFTSAACHGLSSATVKLGFFFQMQQEFRRQIHWGK